VPTLGKALADDPALAQATLSATAKALAIIE